MATRTTKPDSRTALLLASLDYAFDKSGWHGSNLMGVLRGVDAASVARRVNGRRSIWEQLLHAAYWKQRVLNLLVGTQRFPRPGSNWPRLPTTRDRASWEADLQLIRDIHARLRIAVTALPRGRLDEKKTIRLILGGAAHDAYHTGQISAIKKMLAGA